MEYADCVKGFDAYVRAAKGSMSLRAFIIGARTRELQDHQYPVVQKITDNLLGTLEGFLRERANKPKSA